MKVVSIQSGSSGNCYYYESKDTKILIDAGISFKTLSERVNLLGLDLYNVHGLFISHDHSDHVSSCGVLQRKLSTKVFISPKTYSHVEHHLGKVENIIHFKPGDTIDIKRLKVRSIETPHDGVEPCIFIIEDGKTKVGIMTDLGHGFPKLKQVLSTLDILFFESNYDEKMLEENTEYPEYLKVRITSGSGHISNTLSAELINNNTDGKLKYLVLSHLSGSNNTEDLALNTHLNTYNGKKSFDISIAPRNKSSKLIEL